MIIMQIAQTETLLIDENIFVRLLGLPNKDVLQQEFFLQVLLADFTYFK